jgi:hypothetical protein
MIKKSIVVLFLSASLVNAGDSYFPLGTGNRWTYRSTFLISVNTFDETVIEEKTINGESYFVFNNFRLQTSVPFRTEGQKVVTSVDGIRYTMYDFAAETGTAWNVPDPPTSLMGRMTLVSRIDSIITPAGGFFECFHFHHAFSGNVYYDEWFAPGVGIVKRVSRIMSGLIESVLIDHQVSTAVNSDPAANPPRFALYDNYPNPFNSSTTVSFKVPYDGKVSIQIYDCRGRRVAGLLDDHCTVGIHRIDWNPYDQSSGIYLIRMTAGRFAQTRRAVLQN